MHVIDYSDVKTINNLVLFKEEVLTKDENLLKRTSKLQAIQDVDDFVYSSEQIRINLAFCQWVPSESKVQTADKSITIIHTTPVNLLAS